MGARPSMNRVRSLKSVISGALVAALVAGMGAIGVTPAQATPATVNVTVSCSADTSFIANVGDTLVFSYGSSCTDASQIFNWKTLSVRGYMDTALPTRVSGAFGANNPRSSGSVWWVTRTAGLSFSSEFTGNNGSGNANPGDTIALMLNDGSGNAGTVFNVIWQGAPSPTPTISTQPASVSKTAGEALSLSVTATRTGSGVLTYQWKKDGTSLSGRTSATLSIPSVASGDAGSYTVDVTNTEAPYTPTTVTSSAAVVTVTVAAPSSSTPSSSTPSSPSSSTPSSSTPSSATPVAAAAASQTLKGKPIEFSLGTSSLSSATKKNIRATVKQAGKSAKYTITGTAGQMTGVSDKAVRALAKKRANVLKAHLVKLGVSKSSITIKTKVVKQGKRPKASVLALY